LHGFSMKEIFEGRRHMIRSKPHLFTAEIKRPHRPA